MKMQDKMANAQYATYVKFPAKILTKINNFHLFRQFSLKLDDSLGLLGSTLLFAFCQPPQNKQESFSPPTLLWAFGDQGLPNQSHNLLFSPNLPSAPQSLSREREGRRGSERQWTFCEKDARLGVGRGAGSRIGEWQGG